MATRMLQHFLRHYRFMLLARTSS